MDDRFPRLALPAAILFGSVAGLYILLYRSDLLRNTTFIAGLIAAQVLAVFVWNYRRWFLPLLIFEFFCAGTAMPFQAIWGIARWPVLTVGAVVGLALYLRDPRHKFGSLNLVALFCVIAALASSTTSAHPTQAFLKALSLLILFLYCSSGARLSVLDTSEKWFSTLLLACEGLIYFIAACYFVFRIPFFGNPNSLGAVMGVIALPLMLWGVLATPEPLARRRRTVALVMALAMLLSSYARAAIFAGGLTAILTCLVFRQFRFLVKGFAVALLAALAFVSLHPLPESATPSGSTRQAPLVSFFVYKGREDLGVAASRIPVWDRTAAAIREHPWFGTGFGTSVTEGDDEPDSARVESLLAARNATREHGNSYLAITEWVGLLGIVPFALIVFLTGRSVFHVFKLVNRSHDPHHAAVPLAMVVLAGLLHAFFEDWMFAPGYYLCLMFWICAFLLQDYLPSPVIQQVEANQRTIPGLRFRSPVLPHPMR
jgi:O-antigen ligase